MRITELCSDWEIELRRFTAETQRLGDVPGISLRLLHPSFMYINECFDCISETKRLANLPNLCVSAVKSSSPINDNDPGVFGSGVVGSGSCTFEEAYSLLLETSKMPWVFMTMRLSSNRWND